MISERQSCRIIQLTTSAGSAKTLMKNFACKCTEIIWYPCNQGINMQQFLKPFRYGKKSYLLSVGTGHEEICSDHSWLHRMAK